MIDSLQNSGNGVYLNGQKIPPAINISLNNRDVLEFGKDPTTGDAHYEFVFYEKAYIRFDKNANVENQSERYFSLLLISHKLQMT